jgi:hypothetical protein
MSFQLGLFEDLSSFSLFYIDCVLVHFGVYLPFQSEIRA